MSLAHQLTRGWFPGSFCVSTPSAIGLEFPRSIAGLADVLKCRWSVVGKVSAMNCQIFSGRKSTHTTSVPVAAFQQYANCFDFNFTLRQIMSASQNTRTTQNNATRKVLSSARGDITPIALFILRVGAG